MTGCVPSTVLETCHHNRLPLKIRHSYIHARSRQKLRRTLANCAGTGGTFAAKIARDGAFNEPGDGVNLTSFPETSGVGVRWFLTFTSSPCNGVWLEGSRLTRLHLSRRIDQIQHVPRPNNLTDVSMGRGLFLNGSHRADSADLSTTHGLLLELHPRHSEHEAVA